MSDYTSICIIIKLSFNLFMSKTEKYFNVFVIYFCKPTVKNYFFLFLTRYFFALAIFPTRFIFNHLSKLDKYPHSGYLIPMFFSISVILLFQI